MYISQMASLDNGNDMLEKDPLKKLSNITSILVILIIVASMVYWLRSSETLPIKQIEIRGQFARLLPDDLQTIIAGKVHGGFFSLNVDSIRNILIAEPWVRDVSVKRIWPDTIHVTVIEQTAVTKWGDAALLNKAGQIFSPDPDSFPPDLPVLRGPVGLEKILLEKFIQINQALTPLDYRLTELVISERRSWELGLDNGIRAMLGRTAFDKRLGKFIKLVSSGLVDRFSEAEYIDLRYPNGFSVKWNHNRQVILPTETVYL